MDSIRLKNGIDGNSTSVLLALTTFIFCWYGKSKIGNVFILIYFFIVSCFLFQKRKLELLFAPLVFFSSVLVITSGASFLRVYEVLFLLYFFSQKSKIITLDFKTFYGICFCILSFFFLGIESFLSVVLCCFIVLNISKKFNNETTFRLDYIKSLIISTSVSGLYAVINTRAMVFGYGSRFSGVIGDPNYSAYLYSIGFVALLSVRAKITKKEFLLFGVILLIELFSTLSLSGISICAFMSLLILLRSKLSKNKKILFCVAGAFCLLVFFNVKLPDLGYISDFQDRIFGVRDMLLQKDYVAVFSGRTELAEVYLNFWENNLGVFNQLFGGVCSFKESGGVFGTVLRGYSHNSYIDMLFGTGILGTIFLMIGQFKILTHYYRSNDECMQCMSYLKILCILFSATITIFTYNYYLLIWLF